MLCRRLGFHPAVAGALYYSLQATTASGAVFALGFVIFSLQALAGGLALLMSVLGAFGSTMLLGGATGTAVVGGSIVVPAFILSSGSAILVFVAGVVSRDRRRLRRATNRRAPRELIGRFQELPPAQEQDDGLGDRQDHDREPSSGARSRHRGASSREHRDRTSGARGNREERRETREPRSSSRSDQASAAAGHEIASDASTGATAAAAAAHADGQTPRRSEAAQPGVLPLQNSSSAENRGPEQLGTARDAISRGAQENTSGKLQDSAMRAAANACADGSVDSAQVAQQPSRPAAQRRAAPLECDATTSVAAQGAVAPVLPRRDPQPLQSPTTSLQPPDNSPHSRAGATGPGSGGRSGRAVPAGVGALAPRDLESSLSQRSRDALGNGKAFLL